MVALQFAAAIALCTANTEVTVHQAGVVLDGAVVRAVSLAAVDPHVDKGTTNGKGIAVLDLPNSLPQVKLIAQYKGKDGIRDLLNNGVGFPPKTDIAVRAKPWVSLPPPVN
jgi:hypothetical protein